MRRTSQITLLAAAGALFAWAVVTQTHGQPKAADKLVGDGVADDTAAIQRLIDAGTGTVQLPRGVYRVTKPLVVDLDTVGFTSFEGHGTARLVMDGPGPALRFVGTHGGTADPPTVKPNVWDRQRAPTVDGLEIVGNHADANGVEAEGTMQLTLSRLVIRKTLHAVRLYKRNRNVIVSDCHLYENRGAGLFLDDVDLHQINVTGSHISYNAGGGIVSLKGNVRNLHITGCDIESNMAPAGKPAANVLIDGSGSEFGTAEVAITGCTIQHTRKAPGGANVRIRGRTNPVKDMPVVRQGHVTITGNVFSDVAVNVHLDGCRGVVVSGNTFWEGFEHNLLAEDCVGVVVGPNAMDRNPHYERFGNAREAKNTVAFHDCEDCTVTGLHLARAAGPAALTVENGKRFHVTGCTVLDSDFVGVMFKDTADSRLSNCVVRDDRPAAKNPVAVRVTGGRGNVVTDNVVAGACEVDPKAGIEARNHAGR